MFSLDLIWLNRLVLKLLLGPFLGKTIPFVWFEKLVPEINYQWLTHITSKKVWNVELELIYLENP